MLNVNKQGPQQAMPSLLCQSGQCNLKCRNGTDINWWHCPLQQSQAVLVQVSEHEPKESITLWNKNTQRLWNLVSVIQINTDVIQKQYWVLAASHDFLILGISLSAKATGTFDRKIRSHSRNKQHERWTTSSMSKQKLTNPAKKNMALSVNSCTPKELTDPNIGFQL